MTLKDLLEDWTEFDIAMYYLACILGIIEYDEKFNSYRKTKAIYWSKNPLGDSLYEMLETLVKRGILERNDDGYRWNKSYTYKNYREQE